MSYPGYFIDNGSSGSYVTELQSQLNIKLSGIIPSIVVDGTFGSNTLNAVKAFQTANNLTVDGVVGPRTWNMLFMSSPADLVNLRLTALLVAQSQVGVSEVPPYDNTGPQVDDYLASVNEPPGKEWCQAFFYWCYQEAVSNINTKYGLNLTNPVVKTAGVLPCWNNTDSEFQIKAVDALANPSLILPGYQMILTRGGGLGHTGFVNNVTGTTIFTIEGNAAIAPGTPPDNQVVELKTGYLLSAANLIGFIIY